MPGQIHTIVKFVEQRKSPFAVSRLIMLTGVTLRNTTAFSSDPPDVLAKVKSAVKEILSPEEQMELEKLLETESRVDDGSIHRSGRSKHQP
jgi:hypothetical protein